MSTAVSPVSVTPVVAVDHPAPGDARRTFPERIRAEFSRQRGRRHVIPAQAHENPHAGPRREPVGESHVGPQMAQTVGQLRGRVPGREFVVHARAVFPAAEQALPEIKLHPELEVRRTVVVKRPDLAVPVAEIQVAARADLAVLREPVAQPRGHAHAILLLPVAQMRMDREPQAKFFQRRGQVALENLLQQQLVVAPRRVGGSGRTRHRRRGRGPTDQRQGETQEHQAGPAHRVPRKASRSDFSAAVSRVPRIRLKNSTVSASVSRRPSCR